MQLQGYDFKVVHRPINTNIADALSRLNSVEQFTTAKSMMPSKPLWRVRACIVITEIGKLKLKGQHTMTRNCA